MVMTTEAFPLLTEWTKQSPPIEPNRPARRAKPIPFGVVSTLKCREMSTRKAVMKAPLTVRRYTDFGGIEFVASF